GQPRILMRLVQERAQLVEHHLMVGEDDILLPAELPEEGGARDARGLGDLLDRGRIEPLSCEQLERGCDDAGAERWLVHTGSLSPVVRAMSSAVVGFEIGPIPTDTRQFCRVPPAATSEGLHVDLYEYQARDLFDSYGVPVLAGIVADTPEEVKAAAEKLGGVVVVKAQVKTGGRGKAGGVKVAKTPAEAYEAAQAILGLDIKGHVVKR